MFHNFSYGYYEAAIVGKIPFPTLPLQRSLIHNYIYPLLIHYDIEAKIVSKL